MTTEICKDSNVATGSTKQLKDSRDQKYYWVSKLADGNCWMTQNLDFDVPATLSSIDTNIKEDTTDAVKAVTTNTTKIAAPNGWNNNTATYNAYYDPGDYLYIGPNTTHAQGTQCTVTNGTLLSCTTHEFVTAIANTETLGDTDAHYHVGNYYSFSAATVKSGDSIAAGDTSAPNSICPKGWQLPTGSTSGQINTLLTKYGVNSRAASGNTAIYGTPLYFVYGGMVGSSKLYSAGDLGYYWSSTVSSGTGAFLLYFDYRVFPTDSISRDGGRSVRCVAE